MPTTSWLIGARYIPETAIQVQDSFTGLVVSICVLPAGEYYLYRDGGSLDLLAAVKTALEIHPLITTATVSLQEDGKVIISTNNLIRITGWVLTTGGNPPDPNLKEMLGFLGDEAISYATSHTAGAHSTHWWSPGKREISEARLGTLGTLLKDTAIGRAGPGIQVTTTKNTSRSNEFEWRYVDVGRVHSQDEDPGEFFTFWDRVLSSGSRFYHYRNIAENPLGTSIVDMSPAGGGSLGPYYYWPSSSDGQSMPYEREIINVEKLCKVKIPVVVAPEIS